MAQTEMANGDKPINVYHPIQPWNHESANGFPGLTKREYFAGLALLALINTRTTYCIGEASVQLADELLKALDNPK